MSAVTGAVIGAVVVGGMIYGGIKQGQANEIAGDANDLAQDNLTMQAEILEKQLAFQKLQQASLC